MPYWNDGAPELFGPAIPIVQGNGLDLVEIAEDQVAVANDWLEYLKTLAETILPIELDVDFPPVPTAPPLDTLTMPTFVPVTYSPPSVPSPFVGSIDIEDEMPDPFTGEAPILSFGSAPTAFTGTPPSAPAVDTAFDDPGDLVVNLPAPPSLLTINVVGFNGVDLPTFDEAVPELTLVAPEVVSYDPGSLYTSAMLEALKTTLQARFTTGGTGLAPDVENALWDRGREREARQKADAIAQLDRMEAMGFSLPPGVYLDARLKIENEYTASVAGVNREVMIKAAELEQQNVLKAIDSSIQLEQLLVQNWNNFEQRRFDAFRYTTEAGIAIYNGKVEQYKAYLDAFRARISVYEAQIKGEMAKVDVFRAQIAAEQSKVDMNKALIDQWRVETDVALSAIRVYEAEVNAIQIKAQLEKLKVDIYGEQVRGFAAQINAYTAQVEGFKAVTMAETAKQDAFKSSVDAYTAQVGAAAKRVDLRIEQFKAQIAGKEQEYIGYKAQVDGAIAQTNALAQYNTTVAETFRAQVSANSAYNDMLTKQWSVTADQIQKTTEIAVALAKANGELAVSSRSIALEAAKVGGQVSAQVAAAALNGFNWSVNQSWSDSNANSFAASISNSVSQSTSTSENRNDNYNYSV
jgi:hypothetical protein